MSERLDRIEALLESIGKRLDRTTEIQAKNSEEIDTLLGAVATTEAAVQRLSVKTEDHEKLCETLRAEAIADRQETTQAPTALLTLRPAFQTVASTNTLLSVRESTPSIYPLSAAVALLPAD